MKIDILLSTYNGEAFLEELLQSLINQTCVDWRLLVRDDSSVDETMEILKAYQANNKGRIFILKDHKKQLGPKKSFEVLLHESEAGYIMFCDQDDVWLPDKIARTLEKMQTLEKQYPDVPAMVFSDLTVVDKMLREVHPSFWEFIKVVPDNVFNIYRLLINNPVVGCTVMINKKVKEIVLPFPEQAVMHDWWIALNISRQGVADYLSKPTVYTGYMKKIISAHPLPTGNITPDVF